MTGAEDFKRNTVVIQVAEEAMRDHEAMRDYWDRIEAGFTVYGPTQPRQLWVLPPYDGDASDEWKALYEIGEGCAYGDDDRADIALEAIGVLSWSPGPKPGYRPGLAEAMGYALDSALDGGPVEGDPTDA